MSLTLLYRGKNVRFSMKLNKFHWLSALAVFALISGGVIHLIFARDAVPDQSQYGLISQDASQQISEPQTKANVVALTLKMAELQSHVLRLNALGSRLADEANIPEKEFNFATLPPSGGPILQSNNAQDISNKTSAEMHTEIIPLDYEL